MAFQLIGLIYFGNGQGELHHIQVILEMVLLGLHSVLMLASLILMIWTKRYQPNKVSLLVFTIIFIHCLSKVISDSSLLYLLTVNINSVPPSIMFEALELCAIVTYYCMYTIVLFSWVEVVFRVENMGHGQDRVRLWRNVFCVFNAVWILAISIISEVLFEVDLNVAIKVFDIGMVVVAAFSFCLSVAFVVYWIKLHRMVTTIQIRSTEKRDRFLFKVGVLTVVFILCLDAKIAHYLIDVKQPFSSTLWELYGLNYLPEVLAVMVALAFFGSNIKLNEFNNNNTINDGTRGSYSATERANIRRREEKQGLLSSFRDEDYSMSGTASYI
ncbi:hypothetical protein SAMD00019534_095830, partial [Acytostelium subglobosum LB1]|uniref:hypothetical protein n=1 Tax=Acytostelium subglobosum LB1 TaxID=1410327 RepID=UPI000644F5EA